MKETPIIPRLPLGNNAKAFKIQTIQTLWDQGDAIQYMVHSHDYFEMIWVTKGGGMLYTDLREFQIGDDSVFCVRPEQAHRFDLREDMEGFVFSFTESFFESSEQGFDWISQTSIFKIFSRSLPIHVTGEAGQVMKDIVAIMMKEYEGQFDLRLELLKRYFKIYLIYLARETEEACQAVIQNREAGLVRTFIDMLDKNFKDEKMVADYARKLNVSPNYLNRVIKKNTGFAASHHIRQRVLMEAKRLGRYSDAGMKQIAYSLGFSDSAHFSKFFKSCSGTNFSEFKNLMNAISMPTSFHRA